MERMKQIRQNYKNGRMTFVDMEWLMDTVEEQHKQIKELKEKSRFRSFISMATENLELMERLQTVKNEFENYKKAH